MEYTFMCITEAKLFHVWINTAEWLITYFSSSQIFYCFSRFPNSHRLLAPFAKKWNNGMSHLRKKIKPHRNAAALVWNYSISIAFSIPGFITGAWSGSILVLHGSFI